MIDEMPPIQLVHEILAKRLNEWSALGWEEVIIGLKYGMVCILYGRYTYKYGMVGSYNWVKHIL